MNLNRIHNHIMLLGLVLLLIVLVAGRGAGMFPTHIAVSLNSVWCEETLPFGCALFTISKGDKVFFGGNDDYIHPDSHYWIDPGDTENYGVIWIGQPDNVQQGVNEKGLAYDANGLPRVAVNPHNDRKTVSGGYSSYPIHILHESATVEEVIKWVKTHQWHSYMHDQMHFADATGDAVIISAGIDGEVVFTRKPPGDGFLLSTNFNVVNPDNGDHPCWRYDRAQELLNQLVHQEDPLTANDAAGVLDAVHLESGSSWTISSLVADLPNGLVYLYYFHQFDRPVMLNVTEEIANLREPGPLSRLFPEDVQKEAARRYQEIQNRCRWIGALWLSMVIVSVIVLITISIRERQGWKLWLPAVIILGPLALLVWFVTRHSQHLNTRQTAILEAIGDVMPTVIAFLVILVTLILVPAIQSNGSLLLVIMLTLPLLVGWLFFQTPMLALVEEKPHGFLLKRLPHALVSANLGMAGISPVVIPLTLSGYCPVLPLNAWILVIWWCIIALGAVLGLMVLLLYESWAIKNSFKAWNVLFRKEATIHTPSWRRLWWWILLSYGILLAGLFTSTILLQMLTS